MKEPEDVLVVAILDRLLPDCDATLNQKMLYMLSIDSQATAEKMETSSFARWVEGHKKFMGILGDVVTEVAYGAVLYRCQTAKAVSKPKGEGGLDTIIKNGKVSIDDIKTNPNAFSGKSAEEIADVLRDSGYDVTIKNSTRSRSGVQIIQINNPGGGKIFRKFRFGQEEDAMVVIHMLRLALLTKELSKLLMELKVHIKQMEKKLQQLFFREVIENVVRYFSTNSAI